MEGSRSHLLIVDDDPEIGALVKRFFQKQGFDVSRALSGAELRAALQANTIDLILLDLGLPDEDGFALLREFRRDWHGPVIIVSGRGESIERIVGLELGADDYVTKPFDLRELLARVRSVLRRFRPAVETGTTLSSKQPSLRFAGFQLDVAARRLTAADGGERSLTTGEYELLLTLLERPNHVLSRDTLMTQLHGREASAFDRAIDVQISRLRRKIEADPANPQLIKSVRGAGYLFAAKVERQ